MTGLTRQAAEFIAAFDPAAVPDICLEAAAFGITDCVAVMIAGFDEAAPSLARELIHPIKATDAAPMIPTGQMYASQDAAFANGVAAHALDYDDVAIDGHPSTVLGPAILAEGHAVQAAGARSLGAYVAGYEIWALLDSLEPGKLHDRGFHPTAVQGAIAAAAACAVLRGLDAEKASHTIAIAASLGAGLVANFGTMTKPLHAGRAAQSGVIAARLADRGFTASPDALEHRTGYLSALSPSGAPSLGERDHRLGDTWLMEALGVNIKRYPLCYSTHRAIDAMLGAVERHDLKPSDVREIRIGAGAPELLMLRNHQPKTGLEAKFSMEFAMASALVARNVGLAQLSDEFVCRRDVIDTMAKVSSTAIHDSIAGMPDSEPDTVEIELVSGEILHTDPVKFARGGWQNPLSPAELKQKFMDCVGGTLSGQVADVMFWRLAGVGQATNLRDLDLAGPLAAERRSA